MVIWPQPSLSQCPCGGLWVTSTSIPAAGRSTAWLALSASGKKRVPKKLRGRVRHYMELLYRHKTVRHTRDSAGPADTPGTTQPHYLTGTAASGRRRVRGP